MSRARLAGQIFNAAKTAAAWPFKGMGTIEKIARVGPDAVMGTIVGVNTPGDLSDKITAGATDAILGSTVGIVAAKPFKNPLIAGAVDTAASTAGAMVIAPKVTESIQRNKDRMLGGEGLSAWERSAKEHEELLRQQILQEYVNAGVIPANALPNVAVSNAGIV